jgi:hypothetical protein
MQHACHIKQFCNWMAQNSNVRNFQAQHDAQLAGRQIELSDLNGRNRATGPRQSQDSAGANNNNTCERRNCTIKTGSMFQDIIICIHDFDGSPFTFMLYTPCIMLRTLICPVLRHAMGAGQSTAVTSSCPMCSSGCSTKIYDISYLVKHFDLRCQ